MQHPFDNLSREELLALAKQQQTELDALRSQTPVVELEEAGSIADAAVEISGVLKASQRAADIYLQSAETMKARRESEYYRRLAEAEQQAQALLAETEEYCRAATARAKESADFYWAEMHKKLDQLFGADPTLVRLLLQLGKKEDAVDDECFGPDD